MVAPQHIYLARWFGGVPVFKLGNLASISFTQQAEGQGTSGWARTAGIDEFVPYMSVEAKAWCDQGSEPRPQEAIQADMFSLGAVLYQARDVIVCGSVLQSFVCVKHVATDARRVYHT